jgi:hypothetical protein
VEQLSELWVRHRASLIRKTPLTQSKINRGFIATHIFLHEGLQNHFRHFTLLNSNKNASGYMMRKLTNIEIQNTRKSHTFVLAPMEDSVAVAAATVL